MNRLQEFISIVNSKIGEGYVYGGQDSTPLTKAALKKLVDIYGSSHYYFSSYSAERWLGKEYYDCSGLIVYTLRKMGLIPLNFDYTSSSIYTELCKSIPKKELRAGDLCFQKSASGIVHVGIYMGDNRVTHARGTFYGVVNTELFSSFNLFGRLKFFLNDFPEVKVTFMYSTKKAVINTNVYEQPYEQSTAIGKISKDELVVVEGITDNSWYLIKLGDKKGYVQVAALKDYDELLEALDFLSKKTGISKEYWYKHAAELKWLDTCFIKIAKGFGAD
ncbi:NlpC/P60 family protein [Ruminiclostridium sufflavum DSM 19573]|uniref:NlpC/P60 family protein n=1 Tax=Ruminiclostridium sufflavum DSM 19573 TaxID=1121337 RepID=A0A318XSC0_9FIRM|nr:NlpC/P60 family protein [Ruminiclostridium sufflavum]PYG84844.1 NlpC/P60 family protein [Ruminiclostridium sufflavum DSM 19573]